MKNWLPLNLLFVPDYLYAPLPRGVGGTLALTFDPMLVNALFSPSFWSNLYPNYISSAHWITIVLVGLLIVCFIYSIRTILSQSRRIKHLNFTIKFQNQEFINKEILLEEKNKELEVHKKELQENIQQLETAHKDLAEKQRELEVNHEELLTKEEDLQKAYQKIQENEQVLKSQNDELEHSKAELIEKITVLNTIQEVSTLRQKQLERTNIKLKDNQKKLKEKNEELVAGDEELRQNMEELKATQDALEQKKQQLEKQNAKMKANEAVLMKSFEKVKQREKVIKDKNKALDRKNTHIKHSLNYARNIQQAILPTSERMQQAFEDYFVFFKPIEVVSGDFYWLSRTSEEIILAVVDCTGHGVPGAFMSMIGNTLLDQIIKQKQVREPHEILELLHIGVREGLKQEDSGNQDGMDISICRFRTLTPGCVELTFAGAKQSIFIQEKELIELKGDRKSTGGFQPEDYREFTQQQYILKSGDIVYLSTDGLLDNPNPSRKKFGKGGLKTFIQDHRAHSLTEQGETLPQVIKDFQGEADQRDDILVLGIKL